MKNLFTAFCFVIVLTSNSLSQPILTQNNFSFTFTDSTLYYVADSLSILKDTTGADVVFDYTKLRGYGMTQKAYYIDPATTTSAAQFPAANLAEKSSLSTSNIVYSLSSVDSVTNLGFVADIIGFGFTTAKYNTDPEAIIRFPFTYGDSYVDPYAGTFSANVAIVGNVTTNAAGSVTVSADAWGRLDLETISIDSVLRVKRVESLVTDPIILTPLPTITPLTVSATVINYYKPSLGKAPLVSFVDASYSQNGNIIQSNKTILSQYPMSFVSVEEINMINSIELYPNPSINKSTTLSLVIENSNQVKIELLNALGQNIYEIVDSKIPSGKNMFQLDLSKLTRGIYFVSISIDNKVKVAKKLIIE
jgi:hypothetical protein